MPKVSVITSVYNAEKTLRGSVQSILGQSFTDFEFIIVDDGSTDTSAAILEQIKDPRISHFKNDRNLGLSASLNRALQLAKGDYIARHDADDISIPERLKLQVRFLDANPEIGVLGGQMEIMDETGRRLEAYSLPTSHGLLAWRLFFDRSFAHPTIMMHKGSLKKAGGYDEHLRYSQDHELWTRLVRFTRFANLPDVLVRYQSTAESSGFLKVQAQFTNRMHARHKLAKELLRREVPISHIRWMDTSQKKYCSLSEIQKQTVIDLILHLYDAYKQMNIFRSEDVDDVYSDFVRRLLAVGNCTERALQAGSGNQLAGIAWAIQNPFKATQKLLGVNRAASKTAEKLIIKNARTTPAANGLTVVVLTHEREKSLKRLLQSLAKQQFRHGPLELIIFNNSPAIQLSFSKGSLAGFVGQFSDCKVINSAHNWGTSARYGMATMANNESILMLDDDIYLRDTYFLSEMFEAFRSLGNLDMLSSWNELWIDWDEKSLETVSLDFLTPGINEVIPTDTIGPGIVMLNRQVILDSRVMDVAMQRNQQQPIVSDMGFPLMASMVHGSRCHYFPAWGKLSFHDQAQKGAIYQIPGRHRDLLTLFKGLYKSGYTPIMSNLDKLSPIEAERVQWAAETLPASSYSW